MKKYLFVFSLIVGLLYTGCSDTNTTPASMAASETEAAVELTQEEAEILEDIEALPAEEAEPVTQENYEDALKQLEEELETEQ